MKSYLILLLVFLSTTVFGQSANVSWAKDLQGGSSIAESIERDAAGNIYVVGRFKDTVDFDMGAGVQQRITTTSINNLLGGGSTFILKMDSNQNFIWVKTIDSAVGTCQLTPSGDLLLYGRFAGTADFDPGVGTQNLVSSNGNQFLCLLDTSGSYLWAKQFGETASQYFYTIEESTFSFDISGNILIVGGVFGIYDFDPGPGVFNMGGNYGYTYILKLDPTGNLTWGKEIGGTFSGVHGESIKCDGANNVCIVGGYYGTTDFDPGAGTYNLLGTGGYYSMFILKLDASGNFLWANSADVGARDYFTRRLEVDGNNDLIVTGVFSDTVDFNPSTAVDSLISIGVNDLYIAKYNASGAFLWVKHLKGAVGNNIHNEVMSTYIDNANNFYITGGIASATIDFDPSTSTKILGPTSSSLPISLFLAQYDPNGNLIFAERFGANNWGLGLNIEMTSNNDVYVCGVYWDSLNAGTGSNNVTLSNAGAITGFLLKLDFGSVGVNDVFQNISLSVYPNPTSGKLIISQNNNQIIESTVYDMSGKKIELASSGNEIDVSSLPAGVYFLKVQTVEGIGVAKFIKE